MKRLVLKKKVRVEEEILITHLLIKHTNNVTRN